MSRETVSGAAWINQEREASGYQPILIIAVNLVSGQCSDILPFVNSMFLLTRTHS